jgi:hypothetical protein
MCLSTKVARWYLIFAHQKSQFGVFVGPLKPENVRRFYGKLVYFVVIWYILWLFGIFYGYCVCFGILCSKLVKIVVNSYILWPFWYILWLFGIFFCFGMKKIWQPCSERERRRRGQLGGRRQRRDPSITSFLTVAIFCERRDGRKRRFIISTKIWCLRTKDAPCFFPDFSGDAFFTFV